MPAGQRGLGYWEEAGLGGWEATPQDVTSGSPCPGTLLLPNQLPGALVAPTLP